MSMNKITKEVVLEKLRLHGNSAALPQLICFGINPATALCVRIPILRKFAHEIGKNHDLHNSYGKRIFMKRVFWLA